MRSKKLSTRYYSPFEAIQRIGEVVNKLNLPTSIKLHHVFYVSLLKKKKKKVGNAVETQPHLPLVVDPSNSIWYLGKIIARKMVKKNKKVQVNWLV